MFRHVILAVGILAVLIPGACNLETDSSRGPGFLDTYGGGSGTRDAGVLENGNAIISRGSFTLYSTWGDSWPQGACVEMRLKNNGPTAVGWSVGLRVNTEIRKWFYEDGGYLDWTGDYIAIDPKNGDTKLPQGESRFFHYCAEPRTKPLEFWVYGGLSSGGSSGGTSDSGGCLSCEEGEEPPIVCTTPPCEYTPTSITLRRDSFTMTAQTRNSWAQGGCMEVTVQNGGVGVKDWTIYVPLSTPVTTFLSGSIVPNLVEYDAQANQINVSRLDGSTLAKGRTETFFYCTEPKALPRTFTVVGTPVTDPTTPPIPVTVEDNVDGIGLMMTKQDYQVQGGDCYQMVIRNLMEFPQTASGFDLTFASPTVVTSAQGIPMPYSQDGGLRHSFGFSTGTGAMQARNNAQIQPVVCFAPWDEPLAVDFHVTRP